MAGIGVAMLVALPGIVPAQERSQVQSFKALESRYLDQRREIAPLAPPFSPEVVDAFAAMILKGDYSFQNLDGWYFSWADNSCVADGSLAAYAGQTLVAFEDLAAALTRIATPDGKTLASFKAEPWPNLAALTGADYDRALLNELNCRSVALWIFFKDASASLASCPSGSSSGGMMMLMGGEAELEAVEIRATNNGMAVTFAWPAWFANRLDIYSSDSSNYNGLGSWQLADSGYSTTGTNELRWLDQGQLGRGSALGTGLRFYAAGKGAEADSDGDGYGDSYEHLVLDTLTTDPDNDNVSDGSFDPDNTGAIVAGPDAFPKDSGEWLDTDGGDNADTDDDGDGKPDSEETNTLQRLMPITTAPFRVVTVESANPAGDDSGTEVFDVSSAGQMLSYAAGGDARGHDQIHGGIFFNNDGTNLYVGVAGFEKDGVNSLMIFLDTDGTNGGAASLAGISGNPDAFGNANNLSFNSSSFTPNVGILVGNRYADGKNDPTSMGLGQGVYGLAPTTMSNFPGITAGSGAISQWGDRNADSANAGIEIALSMSSLGLTAGSTFKAAAIINGGPSGSYDRWFSGECYGETASGTLSSNNFGGNAVTLIGSEVYVSDTPAPEAGGPPPLGEDDVILQGYYWKVPRVPLSNNVSMAVAGTFNGWSTTANPMTLIGNYTWEWIRTFTNATGVMFKFVANNGGAQWWGDNSGGSLTLPTNNVALSTLGTDISLAGTINGTVRFRAYINGDSSTFGLEYVPATNVTKLLSGFVTNYWYPELTKLAQDGRLSKFTAVWLPPPQKCNSGRESVGYDPFDYYDLGTYAEKFSTETHYGSEAQLKNCVNVLRSRGILPIVDLVLNHMNGGYNGESGSGRYNYQPEYHETFEKPDPAGNNSNQFYTVNYGNQPFSYDVGCGNPDNVPASDGSATSADVNQRHPYQRQGLKNWAAWVSAKAGYRGYRWEVAQNIEPWFVSEMMRYSLMNGQFGVMEFWTDNEQATIQEFATWIELTDRRATMFDQRLYFQLKEMCNQNGTFNMSILRNGSLFAIRPQWAVTLAGDHDKLRPYGEGEKTGITKDKAMAYAFILISEGLPMVAYNDYYIGPYADTYNPDDPIDDGWTGTPLTNAIDRLIDARRKFAGGTSTYLSTANTNDLFIMKRTENEKKPGCILVLSDHMSATLSNTVNAGWANTTLTDYINTNYVVSTDGGGNASLNAPARGYRVIVRQSDL